MRHLKIYENFDNRDEIISELETITHILEDEYHKVFISKGETNDIMINVSIVNLNEIKDSSYNDFISSIDDEYLDDDLSDLELDDDVIDRIMELEEVVEFEARLDDICKKYKYEHSVLYLNDGVTFYIHNTPFKVAKKVNYQ